MIILGRMMALLIMLKLKWKLKVVDLVIKWVVKLVEMERSSKRPCRNWPAPY